MSIDNPERPPQAAVPSSPAPAGRSAGRSREALARDWRACDRARQFAPEAAKKVAHEIAAAGGTAEAFVFDMTDAAAAPKRHQAARWRDPVQIIVNNAGIHDDAVFPGMRAEQWHRVIDINLTVSST